MGTAWHMNEQLAPFYMFSNPDYNGYIDYGKQSVQSWSDLQRNQLIRNNQL